MSSRIIFFNSFKSTCPFSSNDNTLISYPKEARKLHGAIILECSTGDMIICLPIFLFLSATPFITKLFDSLEPLV